MFGWLRYRTWVAGPEDGRYNFDTGGWPVFVEHAAERGYRATLFCSWLRGRPAFSWERPDKVRLSRDGLIMDMDVFTVEQSGSLIWSCLDAEFTRALEARG